jgi:predicted PurR-regulated permease PerM
MPRPVELKGKGSRLIVMASAALVIAGLYFGREVLVPLAVAILLSFLLSPLVTWLERIKLPRILAVLIVMATCVGIVGVLGYVVGRQFVSVAEQLPSYQGELRTKLANLRRSGHFFKKLENDAKSIADVGAASRPATAPAQSTAAKPAPAAAAPAVTQPSDENPLPVRIVQQSSPLEEVRNYSGSLLGPIADAGLVLVLVVFMLYGREDLRDRMIRLVGHGRLNLTTKALDDAGSRISRYLGALAIVNTVYGILLAAGLIGIGHLFGKGHTFPNVLVWGLLVALARFIPYIGVWIAAAVPLLLAFALFPGSAVFFASVAWFAALEITVSQFVEPYLYGASTGMSALAVLISAVFWTWLWGPIGLLLSTPLTVCLVVIGKHVPQLQFLDVMLGDEPVLPPDVRVYQRLIAGDEEEAKTLLESLHEENSLLQVFEEVLVPALALAELDHHRGTLEEGCIEFVRQAMRGFIEELGENEHRMREEGKANPPQHQDGAGNGKPTRPPPPPNLPRDCMVNVLLLPARNESDEIVCLMLHQILELRGYSAMTIGVNALASEMVEMVQSKRADLVCVSAMPPAAVAHARYLCKRIHQRYPDAKMVVSLWTARGDIRRAKMRIACAESVPVVTSLAHTEREIDQMAQPILVRETNSQRPQPAAAT